MSHFLCKIVSFLRKIVSFFMQNCLIFYAKLSHFLCKIVSFLCKIVLFFTQNCLIFYANTCTSGNLNYSIFIIIKLNFSLSKFYITVIPFVIFFQKAKFLHFSVGEHGNGQSFEPLIFIEIALFFIEFCFKEGRRKNSKAITWYIVR